ncbi:UNVERIFIED_CONTAM: hypothetical protein HHA_276850 [Hammondia hammondi]|eukprot:XP_008888739.1 hypothetical protein HHA_276850 [Hammondia hammondi]
MATEQSHAEQSKGLMERAKETVITAGETAKGAAVDAYNAASEGVANLTRHISGENHGDTAEKKAYEAKDASKEAASSIGQGVSNAARDVSGAVSKDPKVQEKLG